MADLISKLIPNLDIRPSTGIAGSTVDSVGYEIDVIDRHLHHPMQAYGNTGNTMVRRSVGQFTVTAGNATYGAEIQLHDGATIESGSTTKKFDFNTLFITAVGTANRMTLLRFYYGTRDAVGVTCTFTNGTDVVNKVGHGLANDTKIMFSTSGGGLPTGLNNYTTYYVANKADDTFQLKYYPTDAAVVDFTTDGSGTNKYHVLTQYDLTEGYISCAATNADAQPYIFYSPRVTCNNRLWVVGWADGGTNTITFATGLHTYDA